MDPDVYVTLFLLFSFVNLRVNDLIGIADNSQIRIMRDDNHLPAAFCFPETRDEHVINRLVVQIIFRLIDDKWNITTIDKKVKD